MLNSYVLAIDCGTQSLRALIFDSKGNLHLKIKKTFPPYISLEPGWKEANPEMFWNYLVEAVREAKKQDEELLNNIEAVTVTTQRDTCVLLDKNGQIIRNSIIWVDSRKTKNAKPMKKKYEMLKKVPMLKDIINGYSRTCPAHWIQENEKEIWDNTYKYLQLSTYLNYKLTGEFRDSVASTVGHIPFDYKTKKWDKGLKSEIFQIERDKLYDLIPPCEVLGYLTKETSEILGLKKGLPIIASGTDKSCEIIGSGCLDNSFGSVSMGSQATIQTTATKYYELKPIVSPPFPSIISNGYNPEIILYRGFWMIKWFEDEFANKEVVQAKIKGVSSVELLNKRLKEIPPGCEGLMLQPYWGKELLRPEAKGSIIGFSDDHTRIHIYRAIIEGLGYGLLEGIEIIEKKSKCKLEKIAVSGGGAQSDAICQIAASIFNRPVFKVQTYETSGLGAAMAAFVGIGKYNNIYEASAKMVRPTYFFEPIKEQVEIYNKLYNDVYKKIYKQLKNIYKEIENII